MNFLEYAEYVVAWSSHIGAEIFARRLLSIGTLAFLRKQAEHGAVPRVRILVVDRADLTEFLMPAAKAAATSVEYPVRWEPLGPWQHGRSSKI
jgi:hypothetical protein